jgi:hypothetical protein
MIILCTSRIQARCLRRTNTQSLLLELDNPIDILRCFSFIDGFSQSYFPFPLRASITDMVNVICGKSQHILQYRAEVGPTIFFNFFYFFLQLLLDGAV